jgi:hypothetical protein
MVKKGLIALEVIRCDNMVGHDFEQGLAQMKTTVEAVAKK